MTGTVPTRSGAPAARPPSAAGGQLGRVPLAVVLVLLLALLGVSVLVAAGLGPVSVPPGTVARSLWAHLVGGPPVAGTDDAIVWRLRTPRVLTGVVVGAGLAVTGLVVQAMVRNPIGDPYVLGLSSGASVGAVLVFTGFGSAVLGLLTGTVAAFCGAVAAGLVVFLFARVHGRLLPARMVLAGVALGQLFSGITSFLLLRTRDVDAQQQVLFWMLGSLAGARWDLLGVCAAVVGTLVVPLWWRAARINLLVLGDEAASSLGADPSRLRTVLFVAVGLLTGTTVAVAGSIGFIGLVVPNLARLLFGADHRRTVPACALLGALLVVWADTAARLVLAPSELPIGILTAAIGVPFFLGVLRRGATETVGL